MMCNCQDLDAPFRLSVENGERKSLHAYSSDVRVIIDPVAMRAGAYLLQHLFEFRQISGAKPSFSSLVVGDRIEKFRFRLGVEPIRHRSNARAFRRTSSAGIDRTSP